MLTQKTHSVIVNGENYQKCPIYGRGCALSCVCDYFEQVPYSPILKVHFDRNTLLFRNEIDYGCIYVVISGIVAIYSTLESGEPLLYGLAGKGQSLGEIEYFTKQKVVYEVKTLTPTVFCRLPIKFLSALIRQKPEIMKRFLEASNVCTTMLTRQLWVTNAQRIYDRLKRLLFVLVKLQKDNIEDPNIVNISHAELGLLINTDRASVTRSLNKLKKENLIALNYGQIEVLDNLFDVSITDETDPYCSLGIESPILGD